MPITRRFALKALLCLPMVAGSALCALAEEDAATQQWRQLQQQRMQDRQQWREQSAGKYEERRQQREQWRQQDDGDRQEQRQQREQWRDQDRQNRLDRQDTRRQERRDYNETMGTDSQ